jgi:hypothetical protein
LAIVVTRHFAILHLKVSSVEIDHLLRILKSSNNYVFFSYSLDTKSGKYEPHNKEWVKEKIYVMLRKQAGK